MTTIKTPKKLIEVALPLDAIDVAAAREKSIRHGHPSTLHLSWLRRGSASSKLPVTPVWSARKGPWIFEATMITPTLWDILKKEVTGIQLLWETVECLYFEAKGQGIATLADDVPLLYRLMQTAMMESLMMRMSRLMDPAASGRGRGKTNLSLKQLAEACSDTAQDVQVVWGIWDASNLKQVRDKYLSHNDLTRSLSEPHTLNIPLKEADVAAMRELASGLREFRRKVHGRLNPGVAYLDESVSLRVQHETEALNRTLLGSELFFGLLPEHEALQRAWQEAGHG